MFQYKMVHLLRSQLGKLDHPLREQVLYANKPFKWTPCFLHRMVENYLYKRKKLSVIVEFEEDRFTEGTQEVAAILNHHRKCRVRHHFHRISCCSADITPAGLDEMLSTCSSIKKVYLNREVHALLNTAVPAANAENLERSDIPLTGKGITTAVIDTGIHPHSDLEGRIVNFVDFINDRSDPYDDNGHGTHCAGDVAGNGTASNGQYKGPAPDSNIIGVKVLDKIGAGSLETVMLGVEWCIEYSEQNPDQKIDVISMSLGSTAQRFNQEEEDPMVQIVNEAWDTDIVVCVAAGNEGPEPQTIASPGVSEKVITVGALDDNNTQDKLDDEVARFSSRGPTIYGKTKPDLLTPGVNIISLRSPNSFIDKAQKGSRVGNHYFTMSGTSMATPICAGVIALLLEYNTNATPDQIKAALKNGADMWRDRDPNVYGAGYINAKNSIAQLGQDSSS